MTQKNKRMHPHPKLQMFWRTTKAMETRWVMEENSCVHFHPPDRDQTLKMCRNVCDDEVAKQVDEGNTGSVSCMTFIPEGQPDPSQFENGTYKRR